MVRPLLEDRGGAAARDSWPKMRQKHRDSPEPKRGETHRRKPSGAGLPGARQKVRAGPVGAGARWGAEARWERGGGGNSTVPLSAPGRARAKPRRPRVVGRPPGGSSFACCHGSALVIGRGSRSLAHLALGLPPLRRRRPGEPGEPASPELAREGGNPEREERGRAPASVGPAARPSCYSQVRPRPLLSHLGKLGDGAGAAWHLGGGGRPWPGEAEEEEGAEREEEEEEAEPEGSAQSCLSSCFYSHPERRSPEGGRADGGRLLTLISTFSSQLVCPRHPGVSSGRPGGRAPAGCPLTSRARRAPELENMAQPKSDCRSPVGLDCCNCCLDLAHRSGLQRDNGGDNNNSGSPTVSNFGSCRRSWFENPNTDKLNSIMRQDSLEPVLRDPLLSDQRGICNRNIDQTMLSILLFFHR